MAQIHELVLIHDTLFKESPLKHYSILKVHSKIMFDDERITIRHLQNRVIDNKMKYSRERY